MRARDARRALRNLEAVPPWMKPRTSDLQAGAEKLIRVREAERTTRRVRRLAVAAIVAITVAIAVGYAIASVTAAGNTEDQVPA